MILRSSYRWAPLAVLSLVGCGAGGPESEPVGTAAEEIVVCPGPATVKGVDVSVYQGNIDWPAAKAAGIDFGIARTSDGSFNDTKFAQNWSGMKAAGVIRGCYHFFRASQDPVTQADLVISKVGVLGPGDLPCTADVEVSDGQSPGTIASKLQTFLDHVTAGTGKQAMIYTSPGLWSSLVGSGAFAGWPLWVANWGVSCPSMPTGWSSWKVWQYSDSGSVNGIPATVDLDKFDGSLAELQDFAGAAPDWGAKYVSQSFPLASSPLVLTVNEASSGTIELRNIGKKTWDSSTRLATTQPRDRSSVFAGPEWIGPDRPSAVTGTVAPGDSFKFNFTLHAPDAPGTYFEYFGVVQEGVHWFSDSGQGGPPDDQLEVQVQVIAAEYQGKLVQQSFPTLADAPLSMTVGIPVDGFIELTNVGTATWKAGETKLAPTPRDVASPLAGPTWISPTRVSTLEADVPPGSVGHFPVQLVATATGDVTQTFGLVEEGITWFADAPKGGGPADDFLAVHVHVAGPVDEPPKGDAGSGGSSNDGSGDGSGGSSAGESGKGCGCRVAGEPVSPTPAALAFVALAAGIARRRRK